MPVKIYHNPRCSKSRQSLALLEEHNIQPEIIEYLKDVPSIKELKALVKMLGLNARQILRKTEDIYKELNLKSNDLSDDDLYQAMHDNPKLIERPIVVNGKQVRIGRPPESILDII